MSNKFARLVSLIVVVAMLGLSVTSAFAAAPNQQDQTIVDIAVADGRFTTLVAALQAAELVDTLSGEGPFTVFAPTDDAFAALPDGTLDTLLADPSGDLTNILLYHVVSGAVMAETVVTLDSADTVFGEAVSIEVVDSGVVLNGSVNVIITDIEASNGVIHVIDAVLLPPADAPAELPATGGETTNNTVLAISMLGLLLIAGGVAMRFRMVQS